MFTGIIKHLGTVKSLEPYGGGMRLTLEPVDFGSPLERGESIAVNGVCLTALLTDDGSFVADLSPETIQRTSFRHVGPGSVVNLERALALGDRLGGHLVQGHVDTVGTLLEASREGEFAMFRWSFPVDYSDYVVSKGSIAVDGISLTIVEPTKDSFGVAIIPETIERTNLGTAKTGNVANLEFDMMAKYAAQILAPYRPS
jgi:riboflavin synthase